MLFRMTAGAKYVSSNFAMAGVTVNAGESVGPWETGEQKEISLVSWIEPQRAR